MSAWRRRSSMNCWGNIKRPLLLQLHHRDASAALFRRRRREPGDERMLLEKPGQRALQLTGAVPVNEADDALIAQERLVEKPLRAGERFVHRAADHVEVGRRGVARLQLDVDV